MKLEAELVELALNATASQLESIVSSLNSCVRRTQDAQTVFDQRFVEWSVADDGAWIIRCRLPADHGALLVKAIETTREALERSVPAETSEPAIREPLRARNADVLVEICADALAGRQASSHGGDRFQVVVHVDAATLAAEHVDDGERCEIEDGPPLAAETARRLACDASLIRITEQDGRPLSVGRKTRSIPPALRRALKTRDGCFSSRGVSGPATPTRTTSSTGRGAAGRRSRTSSPCAGSIITSSTRVATPWRGTAGSSCSSRRTAGGCRGFGERSFRAGPFRAFPRKRCSGRSNGSTWIWRSKRP